MTLAETIPATTSARPPKQSPPDDRDQEIFQLAEIHRWTHDKIALEKDISRRRVSQIVQDVRHWYSNHPTDDPALDSELQRQRYTRNLERLRLEDIIQRCVHALDTAPTALATTKSTDGGNVTRTLRDQPPVDVRLLRMYLRAVTALSKLHDRPELPAPPPPPVEGQPWMEPRIQEVVKAWTGTAKSYRLTEEVLSEFAEELTLAFLGCLNPPDDPPSGATGLRPVSASELDTNRYLASPHGLLDPDCPSFATSDLVARGSPDPAPHASRASHASLAEAPPNATSSWPPNDSTSTHTNTSGNSSNDDYDPAGPKTPSQNPENGSAPPPGPHNPDPLYPQYEKPLHIGPMPMPTARRQPVTQLTVTPNQPGCATLQSNNQGATVAHPADNVRDGTRAVPAT